MQDLLKTLILVIFMAITALGDTGSYGTQLFQGDISERSSISTRLDDLPHLFPNPFLPSPPFPGEGLFHQMSNRFGSVSNSLEVLEMPYHEGGNLPSLDICTGSGYFSKSGSCREFYQCEPSVDLGMFSVYQFSCPPHTIFDDSQNRCEPSYQVVTRPECFTTKVTAVTNAGLKDEGVLTQRVSNSPTKTPATIRPVVKRLKRFAVETVLAGFKRPESLAKVASTFIGSLNQMNEDTYGFRNTEYYLQSVINKLIGMNGKIENAELISLESEAERKVKTKIMQNLIIRETYSRQISVGTIKDLMDRDILESHISEAVNQGLIIQRGNNRPKFTKIQASVGDLKKFVSQEIMKAKADIKMGFESAANIVDNGRLQPVIKKLLELAASITRKLIQIENSPDASKKDHFVGYGGYIDFLTQTALHDTLNDIINSTIPKNASDVSAFLALDVLFLGLEIHSSMLSSLVSSYVYMARENLEERRLQEFNRYLVLVKPAIEMLQADLISDGRQGFFGRVKTVLNRVQQLPFYSSMNNLNNFISKKKATLAQLESEINKFITDNQVLRDPGNITALNFEVSSVSLPIGPWEVGKQVSYAVQYVSESGVSRLGEWSSPYTISNKANPSIYLPAAKNGEIRIIYRRFDREKPESVAILNDQTLTEFRDTGRDILNSVSAINKILGMKELTALLNDGAEVNFSLENKMTPLHYAAKHGNVRAMEMLVNKGSDIHAKSSDNAEALHFAALYGTEEGVEYLISQEANVNAQTKSLGLSALHIAVANGYANTARALLRNGASVNIKDNQGVTPLHVSVVGNSNTMDILLQSEELDVNSVDKDGLTPLHYAARSKDEIFTEKLLRAENLDMNARAHSSLSPLHFAAISGNVPVMMWLIKKGAKISATDNDGSTPLHYAAFYGNRDAVLALVQLDPLLSLAKIENKEGETPLDLALENDMRSCAEILEMGLDSLIEISGRELEPFQKDEAPSNCSTDTVNKMAKGMEETCIHINNVDSYVNLVMSMIPLQKYYKEDTKISNDFLHFDNDLKEAQDHAKIWKYGDSIIKRIRQTYTLAKQFELKFSKKFKINQERVKNITQNELQIERYSRARENIKNLEDKRKNIQTILMDVKEEFSLQYFRSELNENENDLNKNRRILEENPVLTETIKELVAFLEFVIIDTLTIEKAANKTLNKTEIFKQYLVTDNSAFARHARIAGNNLDNITQETEAKSEELAEIPAKIAVLKKQIFAQRKMELSLSDNIKKTQAELLKMRRELQDQKKANNIQWWFGVVLTPLLIGIPLLIYADQHDKELTKILQDNLIRDVAEQRILNAQLESIIRETESLQYQLDENQSVSESAKACIHHLRTLKTDLDHLISDLDKLLEAIAKAINGVEVIQSVFDNVTRKLRDMIVMSEEAKTNTERENAIQLIYNGLSDLECNWKGAHDKILELDECTRFVKIE